VVGRQCQSVIEIGRQRQAIVIEVLWQRESFIRRIGLGCHGNRLVEDASTKWFVLDNRLCCHWLARWSRLWFSDGGIRSGHLCRCRNLRSVYWLGLSESHQIIGNLRSHRFYWRRNLDLEHVFVQEVVITARLIQIDTKQVLSQPSPIVSGRLVLFFAHGTEGSLCPRVRQPLLSAGCQKTTT